MSFYRHGGSVGKKMVLLQELDGCFFVTEVAHRDEDQKGGDTEGNKLGYSRNHKGKPAAEEHVVTG